MYKRQPLSRRRFLELAAALPAAGLVACSDDDPGDGWNRGPIVHLIPSASHRAFILKVSFEAPRATAPILRVGERRVPGLRSDSYGRFYAFRVSGLEAATTYTLQLEDGAGGETLCDPWPLATLPAPDARPERLRVGAFTCAGGANLPIPPSLFHAFKPSAWRRALFDHLLAENPDIAIANGDHVYFDLSTMARLTDHPLAALITPFVESLNLSLIHI